MTTFKFTIKHYTTGTVIFEAKLEDQYKKLAYDVQLGSAVRLAWRENADLSGADLRGANLRHAKLCQANLVGADMRDANLRDANLYGADMRDADLRGANLIGAYLRGAYLRDANLYGADLRDADLIDANLYKTCGIADRVIDAGVRTDGYRFLLTRTEPGEWRVKAGCRDFTVEGAKSHWTETRGDTPLGAESLQLIKHMTAIAKIREWPKQGEN